MRNFEIIQLNKSLLNYDLASLVRESKDDGFRFVERLRNEYKNGSNTFQRYGEGLFGVFTEECVLVAIGGLNQDPYSNDANVGRLRRFYVRKEYRRMGIGRILVERIMEEARNYFEIMVLHTDTEQADEFYSRMGFSKASTYPNSSHYMRI